MAIIEDITDTPEAHISPELEEKLQRAQSLKAEANDHFQAGRLDDAVGGYLDALAVLPPRPQATSPDEAVDGQFDQEQDVDAERSSHAQSPSDDEVTASTSATAEAKSPDGTASKQMDEPQPLRTLRATLNANLAACYLKQEQYDDAVASATASLLSQPNYVKALHRRSQANIKLDTLSSLSSALDDVNLLLSLPDLPASSRPEVARTKQQLEPRVKQLAEQEKEEMLKKLKGIGNSILGTFGLSTDNFQFVKQEGGGYSMNFVR